MDYQKHYDKLIERAKIRSIEAYTERHHIIPKCLNGSDTPENIVRLTPEEHYVAHQLLVKLHPEHRGIIWAAVAMTAKTAKWTVRANNKLYGWLRKRNAESQRGRKRSPEQCQRMSESRKGKKRKPHSEETKLKMSLAAKGKKKSKEHCEALRQAKLGTKQQRTPEWNNNQRLGILRAVQEGKYSYERPEEYCQAHSERMKVIWAKRHAGELPMPNRIKEIGV